MIDKKISSKVYLFMIVVALTSCSGFLSSSLSDEEFAKSAQEVCRTLRAEIVLLDSQDFKSKAEAYRRAADKLSELKITEQSAPSGFLLVSHLGQLADSYTTFDQALTKALSESGISTPFDLMMTEDGKLYATSADAGNIFDKLASATQLEIDANIVAELSAAQQSLLAPAKELGLEECTEPEPQSEE